MKLLHALTTTVALLALPQAASAQDAQQWQGPYAGVTLSWTQGTYSITPALDLNTNAALGLYGGYNFALGDSFVVGAELAYSVSDYLEGSSFLPYSVTNRGDLRLRAGYAIDQFLVYGAVGVWHGTLDLIPGTLTSDVDGTSFGIGAEYRFGENMSFRAEYSRSEFDTDELFGAGTTAEIDQVALGLAMHF